MKVYKTLKVGGNNSNPFGGIASIIMLIIGLIIAFLIMKGIFWILFWLSPILLIAGVAIDPKGALSFGKYLITISKKNPLIPIVAIAMSALWFPVVPGIIAALSGTFLLSKALIKKKIKKVFSQGIPQQESEEFVQYEEVVEDESFLELPEVTKEKQSQKSGNEYDNLFE
jgi:hypothetical protein